MLDANAADAGHVQSRFQRNDVAFEQRFGRMPNDERRFRMGQADAVTRVSLPWVVGQSSRPVSWVGVLTWTLQAAVASASAETPIRVA